MPNQKTSKRRERERETSLSPYMFFPPPGPGDVNWTGQGVLFVLPDNLTLVLWPSFFYFHGLFPCQKKEGIPSPFWLLFSYTNYLTTLSEFSFTLKLWWSRQYSNNKNKYVDAWNRINSSRVIISIYGQSDFSTDVPKIKIMEKAVSLQ